MSFIDNILAKFLKSRYLVLLTGMTMMIGSPASAIEILKTSAAASYSFTDATGNVINSGSSTETVANLVFNVDYGPNNSLTSLATMNYHVTTRTTNDFSFFSDLICTGSCAVLVRTVLEIFVTNDGTDPANFRLDSLITPGHMGVQGLSADTRAGYNFTVTQNNDPSRAGSAVLYSASGSIGVGNLDGSSEASDGRAFNGLTKYRSGTEAAWDWSATNLNLALNTINPGETTQITYVSETFSFGAGYCTGLFYCDAAQVAFGDPRNNGGVGVNQFAALANANARANAVAGETVVSRLFDLSTVTANIVSLDTPLPANPRVYPPFRYTPGPFAASVPEPATWIIMILGFGLVGGEMRRRRARLHLFL